MFVWRDERVGGRHTFSVTGHMLKSPREGQDNKERTIQKSIQEKREHPALTREKEDLGYSCDKATHHQHDFFTKDIPPTRAYSK